MNPKRMLILLAMVTLSLSFVMAALAAADHSQRSSTLEPPIQSINSLLATQGEERATPRGLAGTPGDWDGNGVRYPMVIQDGGTYKMWYTGNQLNGPGRIGYATSPDGLNWTKYGSNPVLDVGSPGAWDASGLEAPSVIQESPTSYKMWYSGFPDCAIGYATSSDGISWTKYAGNPVLAPGGETWNNACVLHPFVLFEGGLYKMWLLAIGDDGSGQLPYIAYATSSTGIAWTWHASNPLFGTTWEGWLWRPDVFNLGGAYHMWYSLWDGEGRTSYATSPNETTWTKYGSPVLSGTPGEWDEGFAADPFVIENGGLYTMWYDDGSAIGVVTSTNGITWTKFLPGPVLTPGDPGVFIDVNYAHDWLEAYTGPDETILITLTSGTGVFTISGQSGGDGWFRTHEWTWSPENPNIAPGDIVTATVAGGSAAVNPIGVINGELDIANDRITGTLDAPWFSPTTLAVNCQVWVENGPPTIEVEGVNPDGGSYSCDFSTVGWDLQSGHMVAVRYYEPDGDSVINIFRDPAPNVRVEKWPEGSGQAMPGGPVVFTIRITNDGDAPADTIYLTDTLPVSTTYLTDSSGVTPAFGPGWVAWTLGPLDPGEWRHFQLVLNHTANPGDTLHNVVDGSTLYDFDFGNNHAEADVTVADELPDLYVGKDPVPGDPTTGQTMLWEIYYGNNSPVASGPVTLTDTLPLGTTVVSWYSENGYTLWTDVSVSGDQLVLEAPTIPGYWGDRILLRISLNSPIIEVGTQLINIVEIATAGDTNPDDNWHLRDDVWVGVPRWNGFVNKTFNWGTIVPGGEVDYIIHARNLGNMAAHFWLTDTLPADTTIAYAWLNIGPNSYPFPPDAVDGNIAVWDLGMLEPGEWRNINLHLTIGADAVPGTALTNCAEIGHAFSDDSPQDNLSCISNVLGEPGPNLEIIKSSYWNWEGQLHYDIRLANIGTTTEYSVTITDTLPAGTVFNGSWGHNWSPEEVQFSEQNGQLVWTLDRIEPTASFYVSFDVDLEGNLVGVPGLAYTNTVDVPLPGDVNPADNHATVTSVTGPDIYVDKWLSGGIPAPGEIVTFTIEFGNQNQWPWYAEGPALLLDTLPPEMTFIKATDPRDPSKTWQPTILPGNVLMWGWGPLCSECWWRFDLVVQISDTDIHWDVLPNTVRMYSLNPNDHDLEWDDDNNTATAYVTNALFKLYLPLIRNE